MIALPAPGSRLPALAAALLVACDDTVVEPPPEPTFYSAVVIETPHNAISAVVTVSAAGFDSAFVRYWRAGEGPRSSPAYAFDADSTSRVSVLGLDTASTYSIEINLVVDGVAQPADTTAFTSGSLPDWIPQTGAQGADTTPGFVVLSYPEGPVIVDNTGKVVWYKRSPGGVLNSFHAHENGRYTILSTDDATKQFHVWNELGEEVGTLACLGFETRFHDIRVLEGGDAWLLCDDARPMDLSGVGGVDTANVMATVLQHLSPDGELLFQWNAFDHFDITDLRAEDRGGPNVNFTHGNAIEFDFDGNVLLSFRSLNEITKVNATTGDVMWRFGGVRNEFTFVNDPNQGFVRQHGLRRNGPGQIQFLDNGKGAPSRFVRYLLNAMERTALLVMDFRDGNTFTPVGGSTDYYANGHGLVSFGRAGRVIEVDPLGNRAWELTGIEGVYVFRAQRVGDLYAARR